jgi:hypothetical protein
MVIFIGRIFIMKKIKITFVLLLTIIMLGGCQKSVELDNGDKYEGTLKYIVAGPIHGEGKYTYSNGDVYEGEFKDNEIMGDGVLTINEGTEVFDGNFGEENFEGTYTATENDAKLAEGELKCTRDSLFESDAISGTFDGEVYDESGQVIIDGIIEGDIPSNGDVGSGNEFGLSGKLYDAGELIFEGDKLKFNQDGSIEIDGKFYMEGNLYLDGQFTMDQEGEVTGDGDIYDPYTGELIE